MVDIPVSISPLLYAEILSKHGALPSRRNGQVQHQYPRTLPMRGGLTGAATP